MALREGWNIHSDIGIVLERIGTEIFSIDNPLLIANTILSADSIECGSFAEVMICLLGHSKGLGHNEEITNFSKKLGPIWSKSIHDIDLELAQELLDEFKMLVK